METVENRGKTVWLVGVNREEAVKEPYTGDLRIGAIACRPFQRECRAFRTVARHPHRHAVDHGMLVAGSQVPGLSPTFSGKRPLLQNFPSGKERKVFNFL